MINCPTVPIMHTNPLYHIPYHPAFDRLQPEQAEPALRALLTEAAVAVDQLERGFAPTWEGLMEPLYRACEPLFDAWGLVNHLLAVMNSEGWRQAHDSLQPELVTFGLRVSQSPAFYRGYLALRDADRNTGLLGNCGSATPWRDVRCNNNQSAGLLSGPRRRILDSAIRGAEQSGVGLTGADRERFNAIQQELAKRSTDFSHNLLDAVKAYTLWLRDPRDAKGPKAPSAVEGLPASLLASAAQAAREAGEPQATPAAGPWRITLDAAVAVPFLLHCRNRALREELFRAQCTKASAGKLDNSAHIERILALRREMAGLLGFSNYADLSLSRKMAPSVAAVDQFAAELATAAGAPARRELEELQAFARSQGFAEASLAPWDVPFWAERLRETRYAYSEEELRAYFQFPRVLEGMFALAGRLFGIRVEAADGEAPVWHPDVRFFRVYAVTDDSGENGGASATSSVWRRGAPPSSTPTSGLSGAGGASSASPVCLACFFVDPYTRPATKRGGAWMDSFRTRDRRPDGTLQLPMAVLVCNQTVPGENHPSLMRFDEVTTLFHEFGHALQHMLTTVEDPEASGIHNIEWDAVEVASQFMENWCYERATVQGLSCHVETGAALPDDLFEKLRAAKNYRAASALLRQLFFAATDMDLHARYPRPEWPDADAVKRAAAQRLLPMPLLPEDRFLCSFSHLFAGGYAAGYYGYKWSEVLSADAFAAFEEAGLDNETAVQATGRRYRDTILSLGGGTHPMEVFQSFRGRPPTVDALLRHTGLKKYIN
jgi:oligopeptidase A